MFTLVFIPFMLVLYEACSLPSTIAYQCIDMVYLHRVVTFEVSCHNLLQNRNWIKKYQFSFGRKDKSVIKEMEKKQNNNEAVRKSSISNIYLCSHFKGNS